MSDEKTNQGDMGQLFYNRYFKERSLEFLFASSYYPLLRGKPKEARIRLQAAHSHHTNKQTQIESKLKKTANDLVVHVLDDKKNSDTLKNVILEQVKPFLAEKYGSIKVDQLKEAMLKNNPDPKIDISEISKEVKKAGLRDDQTELIAEYVAIRPDVLYHAILTTPEET